MNEGLFWDSLTRSCLVMFLLEGILFYFIFIIIIFLFVVNFVIH